MIVLSLRSDVSIIHPYLTFFAALLAVQAIILFLRKTERTRPSLFTNLLQAALFMAGGGGAFYCLMAIYPPNMS